MARSHAGRSSLDTAPKIDLSCRSKSRTSSRPTETHPLSTDLVRWQSFEYTEPACNSLMSWRLSSFLSSASVPTDTNRLKYSPPSLLFAFSAISRMRKSGACSVHNDMRSPTGKISSQYLCSGIFSGWVRVLSARPVTSSWRRYRPRRGTQSPSRSTGVRNRVREPDWTGPRRSGRCPRAP